LLFSGWIATPVGVPDAANTVSWTNDGTFSISGAYGQDFLPGWGTTDSFQFVFQASPLAGDGAIYGRIVSTEGSGWDAHGIMLRSGTGQEDLFAFLGVRAGTLEFNYRLTAGTVSSSVTMPVGLPVFVKLARAGGAVSAFMSFDSIVWTQVGSPVIFTGSQLPLYAGMAVAGGIFWGTATATFDDVEVVAGDPDFYLTAPSSIPPGIVINIAAVNGFSGNVSFNVSGLPSGVSASLSSQTVSGSGQTYLSFAIPAGLAAGSYPFAITATSGAIVHTTYPVLTVANNAASCCLAGWIATPVGVPDATNTVSWTNGTFNISGAYSQDFWAGNSVDYLNFVYQAIPLTGDGTMIARLVGYTPSAYSSYGIMLRAGTGQQDIFAFLGITAQAWMFNYRTAYGTPSSTAGTSGGTLPLYLKLTRTGNSIAAFTSPNGVAWTAVGSPVIFTGSQPLYAGMAVAGGIWGPGTASFDNVQIERGSSSSYLTITINSSLPAGAIGMQYAQTLSASGGVAPFVSWTLTSGSLPAGLSLSSDGAISGTPAVSGRSVFTVTVTDSAGNTSSSMLSITVAAVALSTLTKALPGGAVNVPYPPQTLGIAGGNPPYTWSLASGSLPPGLALSYGSAPGTQAASGGMAGPASVKRKPLDTTSGQWMISGTPTEAGVFNFVLSAADAGIPPQHLTWPYCMSIDSGTDSSGAVREYIRLGSRVIAIETSAPGGGCGVSITPANAFLTVGSSQQFNAIVSSSSNQGVTWSAIYGTITSGGLYTAPATIPAGGTDTITATSAADTTKVGQVVVTITNDQVIVTPASVELMSEQGQQFSAVAPIAGTGVNWSVTADASVPVGTIGTSSGYYTSPSGVMSTIQNRVIATSTVESNISGYATVQIDPVPTSWMSSMTPTSANTSPTSFTLQVTGGGYQVYDMYFYVNTDLLGYDGTGCLIQINGNGAYAVGDDTYSWTGAPYCSATASWPPFASNGTLRVTVTLTGAWTSGTPLNIYGTVGNVQGGIDPAGWQSLGTWMVP
jgi:large repetitive protein